MTPAPQSAGSPSSVLAAAGVRPRKSRGQNFLVQPAIASRIVAAAEIRAGDSIVEVGPGVGILTHEIVRSPAGRAILIELDARLAAALAVRFDDDSRVTVVNRNALVIDFAQLGAALPLKIIGNLPFNVAAAIFERLCAQRGVIARMVLMFQREVARRIRARCGESDYAALSLYSALYWKVEQHFAVAAGSFHPKPKVDAEVLVLTPQPERFCADDERRVLATIRACFSAPRKTLRNALAGGLGITPVEAEAALLRSRLDPSDRASRLSVDDVIRLADVLDRAADPGVSGNA